MTNPLAALTPEQVEAMLVQTSNLAIGWSQAAEHALTDAEHDRCLDLAVGYEAICKMLSAPSPIVEALSGAQVEWLIAHHTHEANCAEDYGVDSSCSKTSSFVAEAHRAAIAALREGGGR